MLVLEATRAERRGLASEEEAEAGSSGRGVCSRGVLDLCRHGKNLGLAKALRGTLTCITSWHATASSPAKKEADHRVETLRFGGFPAVSWRRIR